MANLQLVAEHTGAHPDFPVAAALYKLHKSFLLLVSDQPEFGIGTVAISGPHGSVSQCHQFTVILIRAEK